MIYENMTQIIGKTPMMNASRFALSHNIDAQLLVKLECMNPAGSIKDRVGLVMIEDMEEKGHIKKGAAIIEPTSGNTGIGIAAVCRVKGYRAIIVMPENMSEERIKLIRAYGAEVVLTDGTKGMAGAIEKAEELHSKIEGSIIAGQFVNPSNPYAHITTTGPEIWEDTDGDIDILVAGIGTGGTITGTGKYLKEKNPSIKIVGAEPLSSPLITEGRIGGHKIQGIGANFIPEILDMNIVDEVIAVPDDMALAYGREFALDEGVLVGISSGAALWAAGEIAKKYPNKKIVVILPDSGSRYLSTEMYDIGLD